MIMTVLFYVAAGYFLLSYLLYSGDLFITILAVIVFSMTGTVFLGGILGWYKPSEQQKAILELAKKMRPGEETEEKKPEMTV